MSEPKARNGERGEVIDELDEKEQAWERQVANAGVNAITQFQRIRFEEKAPQKCWADSDELYQDGTLHACFNNATTDVGLCDRCYAEIVTGDTECPEPQETQRTTLTRYGDLITRVHRTSAQT